MATKPKSAATEARNKLAGTIGQLSEIIEHDRAMSNTCRDVAYSLELLAKSSGEIYAQVYCPKQGKPVPRRVADVLQESAKRLRDVSE